MSAPLSLAQQVSRQRRAKDVLAPALRDYPAAFAQYVLRDSKTGKPIRLAPIHKAWHQLASQHDRLVIWSHTEAGKTEQMAVARTLWEVGRNPDLSTVILSNTHGQAVKVLRPITKYIESSDFLHNVFPDLIPGDVWTSSHVNVRRKVFSKDPTIQATGVHGNIYGARIDRLVVDDILDAENCRTPEAREALWAWLMSTVMSRLTANARVIVIGNAWHPGINGVGADALYRFAALPSWTAVRYPVIDDEQGSPTFGQSRWPERWPMERIDYERTQRGPTEFARTMLCVARDDASSVFKKAWVDVALQAGRDRDFKHSLPSVSGPPCYTGVDLAVQTHASADLTVLTTIQVRPDGRKEVLWIESGRWHGPEIVDRIRDTYRRYNSTIMVENNSAQDYIVQYTKQAGIPVKGYTTGRNKAHPEFGVEHLGLEMEAGQWVFPSGKEGHAVPRELDALITELLQYDPKSHTGDRLMSLWFAREAARLSSIRGEVGYVNILSR